MLTTSVVLMRRAAVLPGDLHIYPLILQRSPSPAEKSEDENLGCARYWSNSGCLINSSSIRIGHDMHTEPGKPCWWAQHMPAARRHGYRSTTISPFHHRGEILDHIFVNHTGSSPTNSVCPPDKFERGEREIQKAQTFTVLVDRLPPLPAPE